MKRFRIIACLFAVIVAVTGLGLVEMEKSAGPSIMGNYVLESRDLPDGKQVRPPEVMGMMSFTKDRRNFNVYWQQDGKPVSISTISKYTLSATEMSEESTYYFENGLGGNGPKYETTAVSGKSPVTVDGEKISFKFPLHDEPEVVVDGNGLTATRKGAFVDHWKKVE